MKTVKVGVISPEKYIQRTIDIAAGRYKPTTDEPKIWFPNIKTCMEVLCDENVLLIDLINKQKPDTLKELEEISGRKQGNLNKTLRKLESYHLIKLVKNKNQRLKPLATSSNFEIVVKPDYIQPKSKPLLVA